jgi:hypothetical protein
MIVVVSPFNFSIFEPTIHHIALATAQRRICGVRRLKQERRDKERGNSAMTDRAVYPCPTQCLFSHVPTPNPVYPSPIQCLIAHAQISLPMPNPVFACPRPIHCLCLCPIHCFLAHAHLAHAQYVSFNVISPIFLCPRPRPNQFPHAQSSVCVSTPKPVYPRPNQSAPL